MNTLKNFILALLILLAGSAYANRHIKASKAIIIINNSSIDRNNEVVEIDFEKIKARLPENGSLPFTISEQNDGTPIPYQLEYSGNKSPKHVLVQLSIPKHSSIRLFFRKKESPEEFLTKTFARFVPERFDDFAWENDKIAFRMYGHALENQRGNGFGIDVWAKKTSKMIINKWYKLDNYHNDNGEGLDYYGVGNSLGDGDIATYLGDTLSFTNNYDKYKILDNGPLRSTFQLFYTNRHTGNLNYTLVKTIAIDAGSQLFKVTDRFSFAPGISLPIVPIAVGIVNHSAADSIYGNLDSKIMALWQPDIHNHGHIGCGSIMISKIQSFKKKYRHILMLGSVKDNQAFTYYSGAAWSQAGEITSYKQWVAYLKSFYSKINHPLEIRY